MIISVSNKFETKILHCHHSVPGATSSSNENAAATTAAVAASANSKSPKRLITNLKDFSRLAKTGSSSEDRSEPCLTVGSSTDDFEDDDDNDDLVNLNYIKRSFMNDVTKALIFLSLHM